MNSTLKAYQKISIDNLCGFYNVRGKKIIEIGGEPDLAVAKELLNRGAKEVVSINNRKNIENTIISEKLKIRKMDARHLEFSNDIFDIVFGVAVLEHLSNLNVILDEIHRILKYEGIAYLHGAALWPSNLGHHLWIKCGDVGYKFTENNPIPDWYHLIYNKNQLLNFLVSKNVPKHHAEKIVWWIYEHNDINRYNYEDYIRYFSEAKLRLLIYNEKCWKMPSYDTLRLIHASGNPTNANYKCSAIEVFFYKYE